MGRVHRLFRDPGFFYPLPSLDPPFPPSPKMGNVFTRLHARKYGSLVNERVKVITAASVPSPLIPPFYLIHYSQLTGEQKSRSKLDRARPAIFFFTERDVHLSEISIDLDFRMVLSRNIIRFFSPSRRNLHVDAVGRKEASRQGSANDILMKGITQSAVHRKLRTGRVGGRDIKKFLSTLSLRLLTWERIFVERWN